MQITFALVLLFSSFTPLMAAEAGEIVRGEMERQRIPGVAIAIIRAGVPEKLEGFGLANIELGVAVKPDTVFKAGSLSKQFLAAGILLLESAASRPTTLASPTRNCHLWCSRTWGRPTLPICSSRSPTPICP